MRCALLAITCATLLTSSLTQALEYPIGTPEQRFGMEIAAVYLQPIRMEPEGMMKPDTETDVHIEADIRALDINANGFAEGDWIPYLKVEFEVTKTGTDNTVKGVMMPMVASDGPHYGDNVKLFGPGKYHVKYTIYPPISHAEGQHFGRHTDRLTGVRPWFKPFSVEWDFIYSGIGKKGGY